MESKVLFKDSQGFNLAGIICIPEIKDKVPLVMICHGLYSSKDGNTYAKLAEILLENNIASFRFDFIGHGESEGDTAHLSVSKSVDDLKRAFDTVLNYDQIDTSRIGLFGRSFGGNVSIRYAAQVDELKLLCLNAPAIDWEEIYQNRNSENGLEHWKRQGYVIETFRGIQHKLDYNFYVDSIRVNPYEICQDIKAKVFIVHGDSDKTVPHKQSMKLKDKIGASANIAIIKGANHEFQPDKQNEAIKLCANFLIDNL